MLDLYHWPKSLPDEVEGSAWASGCSFGCDAGRLGRRSRQEQTPGEGPVTGIDGAVPGRIRERAKTLCNFVLPGKKVLPGDSGDHPIHSFTGEELHTERKKESEVVNGKKVQSKK